MPCRLPYTKRLDTGMHDLDLLAIRDGYLNWIGPPTMTIPVRVQSTDTDAATNVEVHIFEERDDEPFVYLATAGLSRQSATIGASPIELVLVASGRFTGDDLQKYAHRMIGLITSELSKEVTLASNVVLDNLQLPIFEKMTSALLVDFNILTEEDLPTDPPVRLLRITPLYREEAEAAKELGDTELYHHFHSTGIDYESPNRPQVALPKSNRKPTLSVGSIWHDIEGWLRRNAEPTWQTLREGADRGSVDELEECLGIGLPLDYRASLMRHDGRTYLTDYEYLSVTQVLNIWNYKKRALEQGTFVGRDVFQKGAGIIRNFWWHPAWIPFAEDSAGNLLCIDMAPGWKGTQGQILRWEKDAGPLATPEKSFHEWLLRYRDKLLSGDTFEVDPEGFISIKP